MCKNKRSGMEIKLLVAFFERERNQILCEAKMEPPFYIISIIKNRGE